MGVDIDGALVQGRTDNLAHAALEDLCKTCYYHGKNALARCFPDRFAESVPMNAVALAATIVSRVISFQNTY